MNGQKRSSKSISRHSERVRSDLSEKMKKGSALLQPFNIPFVLVI